jgi:PKD domain-containing protein
MSVRKLLPIALLLAVISIRCAGSPAEPIGTVSVTQTTTTTTTSIIPGINAGTVSATPAGTGVAAATVLTFGFSTQPSGGVPPYTVAWNFGDGQAGSGLVAPHTFATPGTFVATATVSDGGGRSGTASTTVTVRSVTGTWSVAFQTGTAPPGREDITVVQNGGAVTSQTNDAANAFGLGSGAGNVANPRTLSFTVTFPNAAPRPPATAVPSPFTATLIGTLNSTVTVFTGSATGYPGCPCDFTALRSNDAGVLSVPSASAPR